MYLYGDVVDFARRSAIAEAVDRILAVLMRLHRGYFFRNRNSSDP